MKTKLTKEQAVIISGFTGILCGEFLDLHADVEKRLGRGVQTFEFGIKEFIAEVKKIYKDDFIEIATIDSKKNRVDFALVPKEMPKSFDEGLGIYKEKVGIKDAKPYPEFDRSKTSYFQSGLQDFQGVTYDAAVFENKGVLLIGHNGEQYALDANIDESGRFQNSGVNKWTSVMPRRLRVVDGFTLAIPVDQVGFLLSPELNTPAEYDKSGVLIKKDIPEYSENEKIDFNISIML